jgi:hypothetical protein
MRKKEIRETTILIYYSDDTSVINIYSLTRDNSKQVNSYSPHLTIEVNLTLLLVKVATSYIKTTFYLLRPPFV